LLSANFKKVGQNDLKSRSAGWKGKNREDNFVRPHRKLFKRGIITVYSGSNVTLMRFSDLDICQPCFFSRKNKTLFFQKLSNNVVQKSASKSEAVYDLIFNIRITRSLLRTPSHRFALARVSQNFMLESMKKKNKDKINSILKTTEKQVVSSSNRRILMVKIMIICSMLLSIFFIFSELFPLGIITFLLLLLGYFEVLKNEIIEKIKF